MTTTVEVATKRCSKCRESLPADRFHRCQSTADGLQAYCRGCASAYGKAWRAARRADA